jgi:hypothetical protein
MQAGVDEVTATRSAEDQKRRLYLETARIVAASLRSVQDITSNSNNERTKAIYNFVKNLRAIELGYEAVRATILSLREGGEALAAAGRGDFAGAALHGAAAIKFAATAALAGSEAGGGSGRRWRWGGRWRRRRDDVPTARGLGRRQPDDRAPDGQSVQP